MELAERALTVAFTGHRSYAGEGDEPLRAIIRRLYEAGYCHFLSGMAVGFDLAAAEAVLELRNSLPGITLECIIPFEGQEATFSTELQARYKQIRALANRKTIVCERYSPNCYNRRNNLLVDRAEMIVAWYDGSKGGTQYTIRRAVRMGRRVENLCTQPREQELPGLF